MTPPSDPDLALKWLLAKPDKTDADKAVINVMISRKEFQECKLQLHADIVVAYKAGVSMRAIADAAGVSHQTVANIVKQ